MWFVKHYLSNRRSTPKPRFYALGLVAVLAVMLPTMTTFAALIHKEAASNDNVRLQVLITTVFEEASQTNGTLEVTSHEEITFHCPELFELTGHTNRKMVSYHFVKPENAEQSDGEATSQPAPGTGAASQTSHP